MLSVTNGRIMLNSVNLPHGKLIMCGEINESIWLWCDSWCEGMGAMGAGGGDLLIWIFSIIIYFLNGGPIIKGRLKRRLLADRVRWVHSHLCLRKRINLPIIADRYQDRFILRNSGPLGSVRAVLPSQGPQHIHLRPRCQFLRAFAQVGGGNQCKSSKKSSWY